MWTIPLTLGNKIEKAMRLTSASWVAVLPHACLQSPILIVEKDLPDSPLPFD